AGKRTLAVRLGEPGTRMLFVGLHLVSLLVLAGLVPQTRWVLLALVALPLQARVTGAVLRRARGAGLVPVLRDTGRAELVWAGGLALGLLLA
ncbi:MAG: 1,4-dihydroxy-2-naphthoate polyprenyltransferase, partial [Nocardioidaceae bacterium]|nr:1,4-dihydroxy-2-naphthoate polyprenyltransferase [Nocardioidaceae bacterium]